MADENKKFVSASADTVERPTVILDAGHGGADWGATYNGRYEKDDNLALTLAVGNILQNAGFQEIRRIL